MCNTYKQNVNVKVTLVQVMKDQRGVEVKFYSVLNLDAREGG